MFNVSDDMEPPSPSRSSFLTLLRLDDALPFRIFESRVILRHRHGRTLEKEQTNAAKRFRSAVRCGFQRECCFINAVLRVAPLILDGI